MAKNCVYLPIGSFDSYLPYFKYEKDENLEGFGYFLKEVKIRFDSPLFDLAKQGIENMYNYGDSDFRKELESKGLEFEYRLNADQTNSYYLLMNENAKEYLSKGYLNIAVIEGDMEPLIIVTSDGMNHGNAAMVDYVDDDGKTFINELIAKKLLKKKAIRLHEQPMFDDED